MLVPPRRYGSIVLLLAFFVLAFYILRNLREVARATSIPAHQQPSSSSWAILPQRHPVTSFRSLPTGRPLTIPKIQYSFPSETKESKRIREERLQTVKKSFIHAWEGYRHHAWLKDEVAPLSGEHRNSFGGWAATLVDSLDTLWIMGLRDEFDEAVNAVAGIDFESSTSTTVSVFETTIRYLGGLLSAYDLSRNGMLLRKATELGEMLYVAFDTPNRMPIPYWDWKK